MPVVGGPEMGCFSMQPPTTSRPNLGELALRADPSTVQQRVLPCERRRHRQLSCWLDAPLGLRSGVVHPSSCPSKQAGRLRRFASQREPRVFIPLSPAKPAVAFTKIIRCRRRRLLEEPPTASACGTGPLPPARRKRGRARDESGMIG